MPQPSFSDRYHAIRHPLETLHTDGPFGLLVIAGTAGAWAIDAATEMLGFGVEAAKSDARTVRGIGTSALSYLGFGKSTE